MLYNPVNGPIPNASILIENSLRMCNIDPQTFPTGEKNFALYLLNEILSSWSNLPTMQFNEEYVVIPLENNLASYALPEGVYNVLDCQRSSMNRIFEGNPIASEGVAANAFDADFATVCQQTNPNGWVGMEFTQNPGTGVIPKNRSIRYVGILSATTDNYWYSIEISFDNTNWFTVTNNGFRPIPFSNAPTKQKINWYYVDVPTTAPSWRVKCNNDKVVGIRELYFMEENNSVQIGAISQAAYQALANKNSTGTPNSFSLNKTKSGAFITVWPVPSNIQEQTPSTPNDNNTNNFNHLVARSLRFPFSSNYLNDPIAINRKFIPALRASLSYYLSLKYAPEKSMNLKEDMFKEVKLVLGEDADQGSLSFNLPTYSSV